MKGNYHTHTTFCDGENTPEEVVLAAINKGFDALGFSGHCNTAYDDTYCMQDVSGYRNEIERLKHKYSHLQIYLGIEEDVYAPINRSQYDYIIGSMHYFRVNGNYYSIDSDAGTFASCLEAFDGDELLMAETYYREFSKYVCLRNPDIIGHLDLITKFEETDTNLFLKNDKYYQIAEKYLRIMLEKGRLFEVNSGAVAKAYRSSFYPDLRLLHQIKSLGGNVILSSDSHSIKTLDFAFDEMKKLLKDVGFQYTYLLYNNEFIKDYI